MFKRFSQDDLGSKSQVKSSVARGIRNKIAAQFPRLEAALDDVMPKGKDTPVLVAKGPDRMSIVIVGDEPLFFQWRDGPYYPTLRLLHKYPRMTSVLRVDKGAIKFVFNGADIMCPGLTSAGATIEDEADEGAVVAIYAEGKEHALAVGLTTMSTEDIRTKNKGTGVTNVHVLGDGLWEMVKVD